MFRCFSGKRVFITGHTGFKGSWLALWLKKLGAEVYGYSIDVPTEPANYKLSCVGMKLAGEVFADVRDAERIESAIREFKPDVIFHLAAQPLVRRSYLSPVETYGVNVMGTLAVLEAVRAVGHPCVVVCITTDKCYENQEREGGYIESDPMGGFDPYSSSKGAAEILISSYRRSFFPPDALNLHGVRLASARAGNVIGGGDWAEDRIVVDVMGALVAGRTPVLRNPRAIRPWQHVLEPLSGYLALAEKMLTTSDSVWCSGWNFGPERENEITVGELTEKFIKTWGGDCQYVVQTGGHPHEAGILRLSIEKVKTVLGWSPSWGITETVERTARWYRRVVVSGDDAFTCCIEDIDAYSEECGK